MKKFFFCLLLSLAFFQPSFSAEVKVPSSVTEVVNQLQEVSFTIRAGRGQGSGVLVTRNGIHYIWTAGHVVEDCRKNGMIDDEKGGKSFVYFDNIVVIKEVFENGRLAGRVEYAADVIKYSDPEFGEDLALLRLRKTNCLTGSAVFFLDNTIPPLGTELYHVGSLLGQMGANSLTTGVYSQIGRVPTELHTYFDQTTVTAFPGSSGGGVFLKDGRYVGMLVRGSGETFNLMVPIRRIKDWAKKVGVEFAIDPSVPAPTKIVPVESL